MDKLRAILGASFLLLVSGQVNAATVTIGVTGHNDCTFGCATTLQQMYDSNQFGLVDINISYEPR